MVSTWSDAGLYSLEFAETAETLAGHEPASVLDDCLVEYFQTGATDFGTIELDATGWTDFTKEVYRCCRQIEPGSVITYKELARRAGRPDASRAVGAAMSRNRVLLVIPCHRVVASGGGLRGFSAPGGLQTKQFLLDLESR